MSKIISDESLRRALAHLAPATKRCDEDEHAQRQAQLARSMVWMDSAAHSSAEAMNTAWILDADTTIKLLNGHQDGAEVSYNPMKPGRPSYVIHTYWIGNVRLVLDGEVQNGKPHAARHSLPRLAGQIDALPAHQRPHLVRGDNAFGNEAVMAALEQLGHAYLFKLRKSTVVKSLIERLWSQQDWENVGQSYDAVETTLRFAGWSRARRIVVVRRALNEPLAAQTKAARKLPRRQQSLPIALQPVKLCESAVLVMNTDGDLQAMGQLYCDRADYENRFEELKN